MNKTRVGAALGPAGEGGPAAMAFPWRLVGSRDHQWSQADSDLSFAFWPSFHPGEHTASQWKGHLRPPARNVRNFTIRGHDMFDKRPDYITLGSGGSTSRLTSLQSVPRSLLSNECCTCSGSAGLLRGRVAQLFLNTEPEQWGLNKETWMYPQ